MFDQKVIAVTNKNTKIHTGRFGGTEYRFVPGETKIMEANIGRFLIQQAEKKNEAAEIDGRRSGEMPKREKWLVQEGAELQLAEAMNRLMTEDVKKVMVLQPDAKVTVQVEIPVAVSSPGQSPDEIMARTTAPVGLGPDRVVPGM